MMWVFFSSVVFTSSTTERHNVVFGSSRQVALMMDSWNVPILLLDDCESVVGIALGKVPEEGKRSEIRPLKTIGCIFLQSDN